MSSARIARRFGLRPAQPFPTHTLVCAVAFVATAVSVLWLGAVRAEHQKQYTATATIWQRFDVPEIGQPSGSHDESPFDLSQIEGRVLSKRNLRRVLEQAPTEPAGSTDADRAATERESIDAVRRQFRVKAARAPSGQQVRIAIACASGDPDQAIRLANTLATAYADEYRDRQAAGGDGDWRRARDAAEQARQEYLEAKRRHDEFVERQLLAHKTPDASAGDDNDTSPKPPEPGPLGENGAVPFSAAANRPPQIPGVPAPADPELVRLQAQLAALEEHRAGLLLSRTPLHPEVQDADVRIAQLKGRLASLAQAIPEPQMVIPPLAPPTAAERSKEDDAQVSAEAADHHSAAVREYHAAREAMDRTREEYERLADIERRVWEAQRHAPTVAVELAKSCEMARPSRASSRSLLAALSAAAAVAFGVGLIWSGLGTDLPITTPEQAEAAARVPIVGCIPVGEGEPSSPKRAWTRWGWLAKVVVGSAVIGVCGLVAMVVLRSA